MNGEVILRLTAETENHDASIQLVQSEETSYIVIHASQLKVVESKIDVAKLIKASTFVALIHYSMKPIHTAVMKLSFPDKLPDEDFPEKVITESGIYESSYYLAFTRLSENHQYRTWMSNDKKFVVDKTKTKFIKDTCFLILDQVISALEEKKDGA